MLGSITAQDRRVEALERSLNCSWVPVAVQNNTLALFDEMRARGYIP